MKLAISINRNVGATPNMRGFRSQNGFTLVELMIAVLIALFLVGGLLTLTSAMKRTGGIQNNLSQLHDTERMTMTLLNDVIQSAGYFPNPLINTANSMFLLSSPFTAGQTVYGTDAGTASTPQDTVSIRYATGGTAPPAADQAINCLGATSPTSVVWINTFKVDNTGNFQCVLTTGGTTTTTNLVSGVKYMSVMYGVQTNTGSGTSSVDTYLTATQINAHPAYWANVISVQITLYFVNPSYGTLQGQSTASWNPQTIQVTRTIAIMNKVGVNT